MAKKEKLTKSEETPKKEKPGVVEKSANKEAKGVVDKIDSSVEEEISADTKMIEEIQAEKPDIADELKKEGEEYVGKVGDLQNKSTSSISSVLAEKASGIFSEKNSKAERDNMSDSALFGGKRGKDYAGDYFKSMIEDSNIKMIKEIQNELAGKKQDLIDIQQQMEAYSRNWHDKNLKVNRDHISKNLKELRVRENKLKDEVEKLEKEIEEKSKSLEVKSETAEPTFSPEQINQAADKLIGILQNAEDGNIGKHELWKAYNDGEDKQGMDYLYNNALRSLYSSNKISLKDNIFYLVQKEDKIDELIDSNEYQKGEFYPPVVQSDRGVIEQDEKLATQIEVSKEDRVDILQSEINDLKKIIKDVEARKDEISKKSKGGSAGAEWNKLNDRLLFLNMRLDRKNRELAGLLVVDQEAEELEQASLDNNQKKIGWDGEGVVSAKNEGLEQGEKTDLEKEIDDLEKIIKNIKIRIEEVAKKDKDGSASAELGKLKERLSVLFAKLNKKNRELRNSSVIELGYDGEDGKSAASENQQQETTTRSANENEQPSVEQPRSRWEKIKGFFSNKDIRNQIIKTTVGSLASIAGVKSIYDVPTYFKQRFMVRGMFGKGKGLGGSIEGILAEAQKRQEGIDKGEVENKGKVRESLKDMNKRLKMTKEGVEKGSEQRKAIAVILKEQRKERRLSKKLERVDADTTMGVDEKTAIINEINQELGAIRKNQENLNENITNILDKHTTTKVTGMQAIRETLNSALVASGAFTLRGVSYGFLDGVERYQKLNKATAEGETVSVFKDVICNAVQETWQEARLQDVGGSKTKKRKVLDAIKAWGKIARYVGIGAMMNFRPGAMSDDIDKMFDIFSGKTTLGKVGDNFTGNVERIATNASKAYKAVCGEPEVVGMAGGGIVRDGADIQGKGPTLQHMHGKGKTVFEGVMSGEKTSISGVEEGVIDQESGLKTNLQEPMVEKMMSGDVNEKVLEMGVVGKSEGIEHALTRQLKANPEQFGFKGDPKDVDALNKWAGGEAHRTAIRAGYVDSDSGAEIRVKGGGGNVAYVLENKNGKLGVAELIKNKNGKFEATEFHKLASSVDDAEFEGVNKDEYEYIEQGKQNIKDIGHGQKESALIDQMKQKHEIPKSDIPPEPLLEKAPKAPIHTMGKGGKVITDQEPWPGLGEEKVAFSEDVETGGSVEWGESDEYGHHTPVGRTFDLTKTQSELESMVAGDDKQNLDVLAKDEVIDELKIENINLKNEIKDFYSKTIKLQKKWDFINDDYYNSHIYDKFPKTIEFTDDIHFRNLITSKLPEGVKLSDITKGEPTVAEVVKRLSQVVTADKMGSSGTNDIIDRLKTYDDYMKKSGIKVSGVLEKQTPSGVLDKTEFGDRSSFVDDSDKVRGGSTEETLQELFGKKNELSNVIKNISSEIDNGKYDNAAKLRNYILEQKNPTTDMKKVLDELEKAGTDPSKKWFNYLKEGETHQFTSEELAQQHKIPNPEKYIKNGVFNSNLYERDLKDIPIKRASGLRVLKNNLGQLKMRKSTVPGQDFEDMYNKLRKLISPVKDEIKLFQNAKTDKDYLEAYKKLYERIKDKRI